MAISKPALLLMLAAGFGCRREPPPAPPAAASITTAPTVAAATAQPATTAPVCRTYLDIVRRHYSDFPATQPLSDVLDISQSAHLLFDEPIYLSSAPRAEMWITQPGAPDPDAVLREAADPNADVDAHVIDRQVRFVDWMPGDTGDWKPYVVLKRDGAGKDKGYDVIWPGGATVFGGKYEYHWELAFPWNRLVVVPTTGGVSIVDLSGQTEESHYEFADKPGAMPIVPQALTDLRGILAWTPWDPTIPGSGKACRFVDGKWSPLSAENGWSGNLVHVVPLLDGSALQLIGSEDKGIRLAVATLEKAEVDEAKISALVDQLNDTEEDKRVDAYEQLTRFGPGIWPILVKLSPDQPPEAAERLAQLLKEKIEPTLGGMKLLGNKWLIVADRLSDGGVIFYAADGVSIPGPDGTRQTEAPAWISVRPGEPIALLPELMTMDLRPETSRIWAIGDEWVVRSEGRGIQHFVGSGFVDVLSKDQTAFNELVGIDHRGRWIFRKGSAAAAASEPAATAITTATAQFLVIDPTLPDPTPRLPGWTFATADSVGWNKQGWPVVKRGAAFALTQDDWQPMGAEERVFSGPGDAAVADKAAMARQVPAASRPTTRPIPQPATIPTTKPFATQLGPPLLIDANGTSYYDGQTSLHTIDRAGRETVWPLPPTATGAAAAHLVGTIDGRLYLFNQGGRILRIRPQPNESAPFVIEATFTHDVPDTDTPARLWLDPAGRLDIEWTNRLTVMFPGGYIPRQIAEKMNSGGTVP